MFRYYIYLKGSSESKSKYIRVEDATNHKIEGREGVGSCLVIYKKDTIIAEVILSEIQGWDREPLF